MDSALRLVLQEGRRIRVEFTDRVRQEGRFQQLAADTLRFRAIMRPTFHTAYFAERQVRLDSLSRIWVHDGSRWRIGALVGGAALGLVGFGVAMAFQGDSDTPGCSGFGCVVGAIAVFGSVGAVTGGLLGALVIRWRLVWPP
ncbi:MAG TPA: hypothetical protein VGA02_10290 [Gemmatimonadales bacterium]